MYFAKIRGLNQKEIEMKVRELIQWLSEFKDQEAEVLIVEHESGTGYCDQGGNAYSREFNPQQHVEYTDFRNNPYVKETEDHYGKSYVLIGTING